MKTPIQNCAIYTRKSTEEGLNQDFNSLDAQRESCEAYITSQKAQGWRALKTQYSDGGYSGGNINRPGLQKLLEDIRQGKVQTIVVYKIDRLTRSLMDFAKLVDVFDEYGVSFVSVTQSFNTTTSMGRLTLNVLLSFAQFEREVTGERIRDKIAASKKKGIWMGGISPLGYERKEKKLVIHNEHAELIRLIYMEYLSSGSVRVLKDKLDKENIKTPLRVSKKGCGFGGKSFSRGHLYKILSNPIYAGKIQHKDQVYDGNHEAIIDEELFDKVQRHLADKVHKIARKTLKSGSLLQGKLFDEDGTIYSPTYTSKKDKRYYYYISQNLLQYKNHPKGIMARLPAHEIEQAVIESIRGWCAASQNIEDCFPAMKIETLNYITQNSIKICRENIRNILNKVSIYSSSIHIEINMSQLEAMLKNQLNIHVGTSKEEVITIKTPLRIKTGNNGARIIMPSNSKVTDPLDLPPEQLKRIVRGTIWRDEHFAGMSMKAIARRGGHGPNYVSRCIYESFEFLSA